MTAGDVEVDGILIGYLPAGYKQIKNFRITDDDGQHITESIYSSAADRQSNPTAQMRPGDITIVVSRTKVGDEQDDWSRLGTSLTAKNKVILPDQTTTWDNTRQELVSTDTMVTITGVEVAAGIIDRIAASLEETDVYSLFAPHFST